MDTAERLTLSQLINNAVIVSGEQQRDSAIHIYGSILPHPFPSRLPHNIEQRFMVFSRKKTQTSVLSLWSVQMIAIFTYF